MVRKRAVKSTESGQTPSRPKRNKATHNELEKIGNPSPEVNGAVQDDGSLFKSKSKRKTQSNQASVKDTANKQVSQKANSKNTNSKRKKSNTEKLSQQIKTKQCEENTPKKRKASTCNKTKTKKQKKELLSDDGNDLDVATPKKLVDIASITPGKLVDYKVSDTSKTNELILEDNIGIKDSVHVGLDSGDESDDIDWEDVKEAEGHHGNSDTLSTTCSSMTTKSEDKSVEISIEIPGMKGRKRKKVQEDLMTRIQKAMNKFQKQIQLNKHQVHLLLLVSVGFHRNAVCNQPSLQGWCLSHVPYQFIKPSVKWQSCDLIDFLSWFKDEFLSLQKINFELLKNDVIAASYLPKHLAEVLVAVLRSLGLLSRLVFSIQPVPMKIESKTSKKPKKSPQPIKRNVKTETPSSKPKNESTTSPYSTADSVKTERTKAPIEVKKSRNNKQGISTSKNSKTPKTKNVKIKTEGKTSNISRKEKLQTGSKHNARKLRQKKKVNYVANATESADNESDYVEENQESSSDEDEFFEKETKFNVKTPKQRSVDSKSKSPSVVKMLDDDDDFEVSSKPLIKRKSSSSSAAEKSMQILSSDDDDEDALVSQGSVTDFWVEVYLPSKKAWSCIDMVSYSIDQPQLCEERCSQPLTYVLGYDNDNKIKDVTGRYATEWLSKTQKMRFDADWWEETLLPFKTKKKKMDEIEDSLLLEQHQEKPLPLSITEYKNHPLYVLKRHLLKFEGIYPETAATLGFIRGEAIYSRDCVHLLHTREKWMSLDARVVKQGEQPYKIVKGRVKRNQPAVDPNSVTIDLFGRWQTEDYKPPPAKDGIVPRNEYGNVELYKPSMLPPGTKHIQIPGIQKIAKKLGIDGAPAVVGFDFHCGFCHPVIDGLVVCKESVSTLMDAWRQEQQDAKRRKEEKREKRVLGNWKLLVKSKMIRERLKRKYTSDVKESTTSSEKGEVLEDEKISTEAVAWPQNMKEGKTSVANDGHCHVFPKKLHKKNKITGEWTKACTCGFTLPLDK